MYILLFCIIYGINELFQEIPQRPPHNWYDLKALNKIGHNNRSNTDWRIRHARYVEMWDNPEIIQEEREWDRLTYRDYRRWFQEVGLYTVWIKGQIEHGLDRPLPPPRDSVETLGYIESGSRLKRVVCFHNLRTINY